MKKNQWATFKDIITSIDTEKILDLANVSLLCGSVENDLKISKMFMFQIISFV